jgi:hypothetical protein
LLLEILSINVLSIESELVMFGMKDEEFQERFSTFTTALIFYSESKTASFNPNYSSSIFELLLGICEKCQALVSHINDSITD